VTRTHRRRHWFVAAALLAALVALLMAQPALADTATFNNPTSSNAHAIDEIYRAILGVTVTIFVLVGGWLVYSAIRFRERRGEVYPEPAQVHGSTRLEIGWTIVPVLILVGLSAFTFYKLPSVTDVPSGGMEIKVVAQQYSFTYTYPNGKHPASTDTNTLVVPVGVPVHLSLSSKDVIHDWWVEQLAQKTDVFPGRTTHTWFRADKTGTYVGQCAEFCGPGHATMVIVVKVVSKQDFDTYMADKAQ
jgi:cytochrome c oxidase subunit II